MAKKKCPVCSKEITKHHLTASLECVNALGLQDKEFVKGDATAAGYKFGQLKGKGQRHGDKNIITLNLKGKQVETIEPELFIFRNILEANSKVKEQKDERPTDEQPDGSSEAPKSSEEPAS